MTSLFWYNVNDQINIPERSQCSWTLYNVYESKHIDQDILKQSRVKYCNTEGKETGEYYPIVRTSNKKKAKYYKPPYSEHICSVGQGPKVLVFEKSKYNENNADNKAYKNLVDDWVKSGKKMVLPGKYYLIETKAPAGCVNGTWTPNNISVINAPTVDWTIDTIKANPNGSDTDTDSDDKIYDHHKVTNSADNIIMPQGNVVNLLLKKVDENDQDIYKAGTNTIEYTADVEDDPDDESDGIEEGVSPDESRHMSERTQSNTTGAQFIMGMYTPHRVATEITGGTETKWRWLKPGDDEITDDGGGSGYGQKTTTGDSDAFDSYKAGQITEKYIQTVDGVEQEKEETFNIEYAWLVRANDSGEFIMDGKGAFQGELASLFN